MSGRQFSTRGSRQPASRWEDWAQAALASALTGAVLLGAACTYSFTGSNLPGHIKTIAIPNFENETLEAGIVQEATDGVLDGFIRDGRLKLAPESQADCRLGAVVKKYENKVYNYAADQSPRDYIVIVTLSVVLRDQVKNRDLWSDENLTRTAVYDPSAATTTLVSEEAAREKVISDLAADVVARTLEQW